MTRVHKSRVITSSANQSRVSRSSFLFQSGGPANPNSEEDDSSVQQLQQVEEFALEDGAVTGSEVAMEESENKTSSPSERELPTRNSSVSSKPASSPPLVVPQLQQLVTVLAGGVGTVGGVDPAFTVAQVVAQVAPGSATLSTRVARLRPILPKPQGTAQSAGESKVSITRIETGEITQSSMSRDVFNLVRSPTLTAVHVFLASMISMTEADDLLH